MTRIEIYTGKDGQVYLQIIQDGQVVTIPLSEDITQRLINKTEGVWNPRIN